MTERQLSEKSIFLGAVEITSPDKLASYLEAACGGDRRLRDEVEALLQAYDRPWRLLDLPNTAPPTVSYEPPAEGTGTMVGPYKLLEPIGEGGMGVVYVAEQARPVRRRVALKVIKPGMDTRQVIARFEAERQALAMMDHPNIAKVHDAGATEEGRPYFVMELVRGLPITAYCDRQELTITERLELFVLVCRAVQHAHQKGVIHRDLKPSNILVTVIDGVAVPKVIDFGIAKATDGALTDRTLYTGFHQLVGTPLYMSPEQADLSGVDVDTRSDVYSLGVLLYELLTGTTPFDSETLKRAAFDEMRRIIREQDPQRPSTRLSSLGETLTTVSARRRADPRRLGRSMRGELDWVVMKALEKDRRRRYDTPNDFAADLIRYLSDKTVEACPPSRWYRLAKSARRNRAGLVATTLIGLSLFAGTVVSTWQARKARTAAAEARARADETGLVIDYLIKDVLGSSAPEKWQSGRAKTVAELLDQADATIGERFRGQPMVEARCRMALADFYSLRDNPRALAHAAKAVALLTRVLGTDHPDTLLARGLQIYALGYRWEDREVLEECIRLGRPLLEASRRVLGPEHPDTLTRMTGLADNLTQMGRLDEAEALARKAHAESEQALGPRHRVTLLAQRNRAVLVGVRGHHDLAEAQMRTVVEANLQDHGPVDADSVRAFADLAGILKAGGKIAEAIPVVEREYEAARLLYGVQGMWVRWAFGSLVTLNRECGNITAIRDLIQVRLADLMDAPRPRDKPACNQRSIGLAYAALNLVTLPGGVSFNAELAVRAAREAVDLDPDWDDSWTVLAVVYYRLGQLDRAFEAIQRSISRPRWKGGDDFDWLVLALIYARRGDMDEARTWYEKARNRPDPVDFNRDDLKPLRDEAEGLLSGQSRPLKAKPIRGQASARPRG